MSQADQIQSRCFKCSKALETQDTRELGLGAVCAANVRAAFEADKAILGTITLSGDTVFTLLALYAADETTTTTHKMVRELALKLIELKTAQDLSWADVCLFLRLARLRRTLGDEVGVEQIFKALGEVAPRMSAMATGDASVEMCVLDYDGQSVTLQATTVRKGSEELAKLEGVKRFGYRLWSFPLRAAVEVSKIVSLRWPLATRTQAFVDAHAVALALPPLPPKPPMFSSELALDFMVVTYVVKAAGKYILDFNVGNELSQWLRSEEIGGAYYKAKSTQNIKFESDAVSAYLIPAESMDKVMDRLNTLYSGLKTPRKGR